MKSPHERYCNDPTFRALVDMMVAHILQADFTPSEMREAAMVASIKVDAMTVRHQIIVPEEAETAIQVLERYMKGEKNSQWTSTR